MAFSQEPESPQDTGGPQKQSTNNSFAHCFVTIIIIGLIAVGPEGVWLTIKNLLPDISNKQA